MKPTALATEHANTLSKSSMLEIANFARSVATKWNDGMTSEEVNAFANLEAAINDVLELQAEVV